MFVSCEHENFIIIYLTFKRNQKKKIREEKVIKYALEVLNVCGTKTRI